MAALGNDFVSRTFELTHGVWMVHDVSGVNVANDLVEDEAGGDNFPDVFAFCGFVFDYRFRYIAPMAEEKRDGALKTTRRICWGVSYEYHN